MTDNAAAGATPVVAGATPTQTPPAQPAATPPAPQPTSATDDDYPEGLGDAGKRAIDRMKAQRDAALDRAKAAETERDGVKAKHQSAEEKALEAAKQAGSTEAAERFHGAIRRSEVKAKLLESGIDPSLVDIASRADQFAALKVNDEGQVEGIDGAVEAFKKATPALFSAKPKPAPGSSGLGPQGSPANAGTDLNTWIRREAGRV